VAAAATADYNRGQTRDVIAVDDTTSARLNT
jgi:hypothetical protein